MVISKPEVYKIDKNFLGIEEKYSSYEKSNIVIIPVPFEATTSYGKGTALGPEAIINASHYVEFFDEETKKEVCFEKGICTLQKLMFKNLSLEKAFQKIYEVVLKEIRNKKFVVTLGGEHSVSNPIIKAHFDYFKKFSVLHFDAHSDLRQEYEGSKFSHASFAARVYEFNPDIVQVGIRAQCKEEAEFIRKNRIKTFYAYEIKQGKYGKNWQEKILEVLKEDIYITFDVDFFDPSIMPSTGTPEPGGFLWDETLKMLKMLGERKNVIGFDVVELSPKRDLPFADFLTAKLIYKMLNYFIK